jgi:hypothetical protein
MKYFCALIIFLPNISFAHCPIALDVNGEQYCTSLNWLNGDKKIKGQLEETAVLSPYLIPSGEIPQKWIYAKAEFLIWKNGDSTHTAQTPEGLRIFPYMTMADGHHHSTSYEFNFDNANQRYVVAATALQSMPGCWSFRWTTDDMDDLATSQHLTNVSNYTNLSPTDNATMNDFCTAVSDGSNDSENNGHHHH